MRSNTVRRMHKLLIAQGPRSKRSVSSAGADERAAPALDTDLLLRGPCAINSLCIRRTVFDRIGAFDTKYRLAADREWMLRAWIAAVPMVEIERPVYRYLMHDGSST